MNSKSKIKKYLKAPEGNTMSEAVEWHDLLLLKDTAMTMIEFTDPRYSKFEEYVNNCNVRQIRQFFKANGFSFVKDQKETVKDNDEA